MSRSPSSCRSLRLRIDPEHPFLNGGPVWWAVFSTPSGREVARTLVSGATPVQARQRAQKHLRTLKNHA